MRAAWRPDRVGVGAVVAAVAAVGCAGAGAGFANGDAAVYAAQGWAGDLGQRVVHVGWIAAAVALAPLAGEALPAWMDGVTALFAALSVAATARLAGVLDRSPLVAAVATAAVVLPLASSAEVDVPWFALCALAATAPRAGGALLVAGAVLVSPTALLALPWLAVTRWRVARRRGELEPLLDVAALVLAAVAAVACLTVGSAGAWWTGERGVLTSTHTMVKAAWFLHAVPLGLVPLALLAVANDRRGCAADGVALLAGLPLVLAPPDVPSWLVPAGACAVLAAGARGAPRWGFRRVAGVVTVAVLAWDVLAAGATWAAGRERVTREVGVIGAVLADLGPDDALVAPWSWGTRASVMHTGDPYALPWRVPGRPVRDQAERFCGQAFRRVAVLPPGAKVPGVEGWEAGPEGTWWAPGADPGWQALQGCGEAGGFRR